MKEAGKWLVKKSQMCFTDEGEVEGGLRSENSVTNTIWSSVFSTDYFWGLSKLDLGVYFHFQEYLCGRGGKDFDPLGKHNSIC